MRNPKNDNFIKAILEAIKSGEMHIQRGQVTEVNVYHDDKCGIWNNEPCNCDPDIIQEPITEQIPSSSGSRKIKHCAICGKEITDSDFTTISQHWIDGGGFGKVPDTEIVHLDCDNLETKQRGH
jgi:hypothetical protein